MKSVCKAAVLTLGLTLGAGCTVPGPGEAPGGVFDPYESANRAQHERSKRLDRAVIRPAARGYVATVPQGVRENVSNFADTMSLPRTVVNQVLQGRPGDATRNTLRFAINATLGIGGLADVASDLGLPRDDSGFGETLYVWGVPEGAYLELPLLGPSTERDAVGDVVDIVSNPLRGVLPVGVRRAGTAAAIGDRLNDRGEFAGTIDSILYDSADSYAQARLIYLQNRRFELGDTTAAEEEYIDPMALDTEGF